MTRIAIIDHNEHRLYVEDITDEMLEMYNGDEQAYINDNYNMENYSWDYIEDANYISGKSDFYDPIEIDFEGMI